MCPQSQDEIIKRLKQSQKAYDYLHKETGFQDEKEAYEVLAYFVKGNRALDIGCGYGFMEQISREVVGLDFSLEALKIAKTKGAHRLLQAIAEMLPFKDNAFDVSVSFGVLEHCVDQYRCIQEMARVSNIQILIVHASLPWGLELIRPLALKLLGLKDQPVEKPLSMKNLKEMTRASGLRVIFEGLWNYIDLRWICKAIPYGIMKIPSHHFLVTIKTDRDIAVKVYHAENG